MLQAALTTIISLLRKPLFGTVVIPRDATVDPGLFPEDDYPVHCTKCGYLLRGLPDGKCPECGTPFERGHLLIKTYVNAWRGAPWRKSAAWRWSRRFVIAGIALPILAQLGAQYLVRFAIAPSPSPPTVANLDLAMRFLYGAGAMMLAGPLLLFVSLVIHFKATPPGARKRRRSMIDAIKQADARRKLARAIKK